MIDLLIVDDNLLVRAAIRAYLDSTELVRVVGEAGHGQEALAVARRLRPTVTLLDHRMPIADGLSVVSELAQYTLVLALTADSSDDLIRSMLTSGARGFLVHGQFEPPDLLRAVLAVAAGQAWLSPVAASVATSALRDQRERERERHLNIERQKAAHERFRLTTQERVVLSLLCEGLSNAAIGDRLALTEKTVKNHLSHVFAKLQVKSRTEAMALWSSDPSVGRG
jgi:DNA-binding NarL/FixJ family response regulator